MYRAQITEIGFTFKHVLGFDRVADVFEEEELSEDLVEAILVEAGRFAADEIAPLNKIADSHGTPLKNGEVTPPPLRRDAYRA